MTRIISDETSASLTIKIYGIEARYDAKSEEQKEKAKQIINLLQRQEQRRTIDVNDALRTTSQCGLGGAVAEAFDQAVRKEQRNTLLGLASSFVIYALARKYDWHPLIEGGAGLCGLANVLLYAKASLAGVIAHQYLGDSSK